MRSLHNNSPNEVSPSICHTCGDCFSQSYNNTWSAFQLKKRQGPDLYLISDVSRCALYFFTLSLLLLREITVVTIMISSCHLCTASLSSKQYPFPGSCFPLHLVLSDFWLVLVQNELCHTDPHAKGPVFKIQLWFGWACLQNFHGVKHAPHRANVKGWWNF